MKIAIIGSGNVGGTLAQRLIKANHTVLIGAQFPLSDTNISLATRIGEDRFTSVENAVKQSEIVFLATPFQANQEVLQSLQFEGKTLVDCTNPVGAGISHGLKSEISGSEKVQEWAPDAKVVKAFTIYGFENFIDNSFPNYNVKPVMMIAGNDAKAKNQVQQLITDLGFETLDTGLLDQALHLEHLTLLWVKMVRKNGHHPNFVWAYLEK
ncbi:NADPH-dependent F420 reductase [Flavobacterium sp.]|uniref:NADPH-dependent F420 reductase n=1 Tax=Flavobacterium sp. TaxID=239 RepID=UPI002B4B3B33|nr:NADPH-dependent F420 reductase [Flavobacterium sp.]HLP64794.1 NADPH-dependent F420 reductase [Flavobacterium sp.]